MANGVFNPGTGTLKSTTLPQAFLECALLIQNEEKDTPLAENAQILIDNNLTAVDNINITVDLNTDSLTINASNIPIQIAVDSTSGDLIVTPVDYLAPFVTAGIVSIDSTLDVTDADINKNTKVGALFELAQKIQIEENAKDPQINNVNIAVNLEDLTANINATFNTIPSIDSTDGKVKLTVTNYLA